MTPHHSHYGTGSPRMLRADLAASFPVSRARHAFCSHYVNSTGACTAVATGLLLHSQCTKTSKLVRGSSAPVASPRQAASLASLVPLLPEPLPNSTGSAGAQERKAGRRRRRLGWSLRKEKPCRLQELRNRCLQHSCSQCPYHGVPKWGGLRVNSSHVLQAHRAPPSCERM